jgi:hypothetical protein
MCAVLVAYKLYMNLWLINFSNLIKLSKLYAYNENKFMTCSWLHNFLVPAPMNLSS